MLALLLALAGASTVNAHIALWDKGMFGLNYPYQADDPTNNNYNNNEPVNPLRESDALVVQNWFGHGFKNYPPKAGDFMVLPAGGVYTGENACNRAFTSLRDPGQTYPLEYYACPTQGSLHVMNQFNQTVDNKWFGGTSLAIAYTSDVNSIAPNDMTVISVNATQVWTREVEYQIPAGLPPCPSGGCICSWNWIHEANHGEGYPYEMYNILYRCQITGQTDSTKTVPRGGVPTDCTNNPSACVKGAKTPMYLYQANGNNLPHLEVPPSYNSFWGFSDGAQNDVFQAPATPAPTTYLVNPYATPSGSNTISYTRGVPTATAIPTGWTALGCFQDNNNPRTLNGAYAGNVNNLTITMCTDWCQSNGFKYAGVEYGQECWCGNDGSLLKAINSTLCNSPCAGDQWANCGGSYALNVFAKGGVVSSSSPSVSASATVAPSSSSTSKSATASPTISPTGTPTKSSSSSTSKSSTSSSAASTPSSVSSTVMPNGWVSLGCQQDGNPRLLSGWSTSNANMTQAWCANTCQSKGFTYAGVESGRECYCGSGNVVLKPAVSGQCNTPCSGNSTTTCGGAWRLNVFSSVVNGTAPASPSVSVASSSSSASSLSSSSSSSSSASVKPSNPVGATVTVTQTVTVSSCPSANVKTKRRIQFVPHYH